MRCMYVCVLVYVLGFQKPLIIGIGLLKFTLLSGSAKKTIKSVLDIIKVRSGVDSPN